jgi:hypothetical protein
MKTIHELSSVTPHPEYDLFVVPATQLTVEKNIQTEHRPISIVTDSRSVIQFEINSAYDEYIQLRDSLLRIKLKINIKRSDGADVTENDWKKISPVNYLLQSLFSNVQVEIGGKPITMTPHSYPYKSYFNAILGYTKDARTSYLSAAGFFDDKNTKVEFNEKQSQIIRPVEITTDGKGQTIELEGKLHLDFFAQPKALLGGVQMKLFLIPNDPKFYLILKDNTILPHVEFEDISLFMNRSKVSYPVVSAHSRALMKGTAKYPIVRGLVKAFNINSGTIDTTIDNAVFGVIPRRIFIVLVSNQAFSGSYLINPYNFQKYDLNFLAVHIDGQQFPMKPYTPDFDKKFYSREYLALFESLNQLTTDSTISLTKEEWANGNVIYGFNFSPDLGDDCCKTGYASPISSGALKIELKFKRPLTETVSVLMYCEFDSLIEIDINREVKTDYM